MYEFVNWGCNLNEIEYCGSDEVLELSQISAVAMEK